MSSIDLSKIDPGTLCELERQIRAASSDAYVTISFNLEDNLVVFSVYGNKPEWHRVCIGLGETLAGAVRKCGEALAAAQENQEASNGQG